MRNILLAQFLNPWGGGMQRAMTEDLRQLSTVFPDTVLLITHEYENWVSNLRDYRRSFSLQDERIVSLTKFAQESALGRWYDTAKDSLILKIKEISSAAFERSNLLKLQADGRNYIFWTDRTSGYESESKTENLNSDSIATIVKKSRVVTVWSDSGVKKYLLSDGRIEKIKYLDHRWQETGATYLNKIGNVVFEWVADDFYGRKYKQFIDFNYPEAVLGERDFRRVLLNFYLGQEGAESNLIVQDIGLAPTVYCLNDRWLRKIFFVFHAAHFKWGQKDVTDLRATEASLLLQKSLFDSSQVCVVTKTRQQAADISETCPWTATANVAISNFHPPPPSDAKILEEDGGLHLYFVGRLASEKRPLDAVQVFDKLSRQLDQTVTLTIIGNGPMEKQVMEAIKNSEFSSNIEFLGFRNRPWDFIRLSGICLMTSIAEGQSYTVLEAIQNGLAIASYPVPYVSSLDVMNHANSQISQTETVESLAAAALDLHLRQSKYPPNEVSKTIDSHAINEESRRKWQTLLEGRSE